MDYWSLLVLLTHTRRHQKLNRDGLWRCERCLWRNKSDLLRADCTRHLRATTRHALVPNGLYAFVSFTMLLLISWSASQPEQATTTSWSCYFLAPWGWIVIRKPSEAFRSIFQNWILVALPLLSMVSTLWSDYPTVSLKGGAQYLVTTVIGIWAGYCIKPRILMSALLSALALLAIVSILDGNRDYNIYTGEYTLIGVFGSKNYFALCISLLLLTAIAVALDRSQTSTFRILGIASVCLAAPLLVYARSVGALVVSISALAISIILRFISRFTVASRITLIILTLLPAALVGTAATMEIAVCRYTELLRKGRIAHRTYAALGARRCGHR